MSGKRGQGRGPPSNREPELAADMSGKPLPYLDEGKPEFTLYTNFSLTRLRLCAGLYLILIAVNISANTTECDASSDRRWTKSVRFWLPHEHLLISIAS